MSAADWEPLPGDTRGNVTGLAKGVADVVYATTPVGVYRSSDAGRTWAISSVESGVAFGEAVAVMGDDMFAGAPSGLHRSRDGGRTWQLVLGESRVTAVCAGAGVILVGTDTDGVLRSEDGGGHWLGVNAGLLDLEVLALALSPTFLSDRTAFAGTASGVYRSRNGGDSWRAAETGLDDPAVQCIALGPDRLVVAGTEADGLVCSDDGGTSWPQPADLAGRSVTAVAICSTGNIVAATDVGVFVSGDRGQAWERSSDGPTDVLALLFVEPGVLLAGAERTGVWRSEDGGATWTASSTGLHASLLSMLVVGPDDTLWAAGPTEGIRVWHNGAWQAHAAELPDAPLVGLSVAADGSVFAATPRALYEWSGDIWRESLSEPVRAVCGVQPLVVLAGRLLTSDDRGETWRTLSTPFDLASVIAVAAEANTVAVASREASETVVWRSDDGGGRWQRIRLDATLTALAVSPDGSVWIATTSGMFISRAQDQPFMPTTGPQRVIALAPTAGPVYALEPGGRVWRGR